MENEIEYQNYVQQISKDLSKLKKQYKMFEDLKERVHALKQAAATEPAAAKRYQEVLKIQKDKKFIDTVNEVKKMINTVGKQLDMLAKSGVPVKKGGATKETKFAAGKTKPVTKTSKRQFV